MQFDARAAKILAPGAHLTVGGCPGLRLEASASRRTWTYRYKSPIDARMRQVAIGQWPAMPLPAAAGAWSALRALRDAGRDPVLERRAAAPARPGPAAVFTVRAAADDYLAGHVDRHRKPKGAAEVRRMFAKMLGPIEARPAVDVTRAEAFALLERYRDTPVLAAKLRLELGAAWAYALDAGALPEAAPNWWRQVMRGRLRSKGRTVEGQSLGTAKRVLSEAEVGQLLRWLPNFGRTARDALTFYLWTGARGGEILAMHASEISEEADGLWWTVPKAKTKNARHDLASDLRVPLIGRAEATARRLCAAAPAGYLFPSGDSHVEQESVGNVVRYYQPYSTTRPEHRRPRLTVTHWAPHDLRRTVRTLLASLGCPSDVAEAILGHVQPGVQGVYNRHGYDAQRRVWLDRLSTALEGYAAASGERDRQKSEPDDEQQSAPDGEPPDQRAVVKRAHAAGG